MVWYGMYYMLAKLTQQFFFHFIFIVYLVYDFIINIYIAYSAKLRRRVNYGVVH